MARPGGRLLSGNRSYTGFPGVMRGGLYAGPRHSNSSAFTAARPIKSGGIAP